MSAKRIFFTIVLSTMLLLNACQSADEAAATETATLTAEPSTTSTSIPPTATATVIPTSTSTPTPAPTATPQVVNRLHGLNLGPYLYDDPNYGADISVEDLSELIERIAPYTYWIRTYGVQNGLRFAGAIAHKYGLQVAAGAWLGSDLAANETEMESLIEMAQDGDVDMAVIGNETLLRGDLTSRELLIYINRFKQAVPEVPVTTADTWEELQQYPELNCFICTNARSTVSVAQVIIDRGMVGKIVIIGADEDLDVARLLEKGIIQATIVRDAIKMGETAVLSLAQKGITSKFAPISKVSTYTKYGKAAK